MTRDLLPVGTYVYHRVLIDGQPTPGGESEPEVQTLSVRGNYFSAMHIPIRARRDVSAMDREAQPATGDRQRGVRPGQLVPNWSAQLESILNRARDETHEWMMIIGAAGKAS